MEKHTSQTGPTDTALLLKITQQGLHQDKWEKFGQTTFLPTFSIPFSLVQLYSPTSIHGCVVTDCCFLMLMASLDHLPLPSLDSDWQTRGNGEVRHRVLDDGGNWQPLLLAHTLHPATSGSILQHFSVWMGQHCLVEEAPLPSPPGWSSTLSRTVKLPDTQTGCAIVFPHFTSCLAIFA